MEHHEGGEAFVLCSWQMEKGCRYTRQQYTRTGLGEERKSGRNLEPNRRSLLAGVWSELTLGIAAVPLPSALLGGHQRATAVGQGKKLGEMCTGNQGASSSLLPSKKAAFNS